MNPRYIKFINLNLKLAKRSFMIKYTMCMHQLMLKQDLKQINQEIVFLNFQLKQLKERKGMYYTLKARKARIKEIESSLKELSSKRRDLESQIF